jgi:hypothetical protein
MLKKEKAAFISSLIHLGPYYVLGDHQLDIIQTNKSQLIDVPLELNIQNEE